MKNLFGVVALAATLAISSCGGSSEVKVDSVSEGLTWCESVLAYQDGLLIANFGSAEPDSFNTEGKGYVTYYVNGEMKEFIKADGYLNAPKGMLVCGDKLYVSDLNKLVIYDLSNKSAAPTLFDLPEGNLCVNHLVQVDDYVLVTATDSGDVWSFDLDENSMPVESSLSRFINVPGANGLLYDGSSLYIASYPFDSIAREENVVYKVSDMNNPVLERVIERPGLYDGFVLVGDNLYVSDWLDGGVLRCIDLKSGNMDVVNKTFPIPGIAEMDLMGDKIAVPDMLTSVVYFFDAK